MDKGEWREAIRKVRVMMGTEAHHKMGELSRNDPDYFMVTSKDKDNYYGHWLTGFGFINVRFPKRGCREMTDKERHYLEDHPIS